MNKEFKEKIKNVFKSYPYLALIIPLLIYHGQEKWNIGLKLRNLVEVIPEE